LPLRSPSLFFENVITESDIDGYNVEIWDVSLVIKPECEIADHTKKESERAGLGPACFFAKKRGLRCHQVLTVTDTFTLTDNYAYFF